MRTLLNLHLPSAPHGSVMGMLDRICGQAGFARALEMLCLLQTRLPSRELVELLLAADRADWLDAPPAYRHDNGYFKLPLLRSSGSGATLRLNIWTRGMVNMENVHDHRWDYASRVLCGHLNEQQYCPMPGGAPRNWFQYNPRGNSGSYELVRRGETALRLVQQDRIDAGRYYLRPHCLMHAVAPAPDSLTATLQITFNPIAAGISNVFSLEELTRDSARVLSPPMTGQEITSTLQSLHSVLTGQ